MRRSIDLGGDNRLDLIHEDGMLEVAVIDNGRVDDKIIFDEEIITDILDDLMDIQDEVVEDYNVVRQKPSYIYELLRDSEEARVELVSQVKDVSDFNDEIIMPLAQARHIAKNRGLLD